jgi:thioredoxin 1
MAEEDNKFIRSFGLEMVDGLGSNGGITVLAVPFPGTELDESNGESTLSDKIVYVTDDTFEQEVTKAEGTVLVDYWADWCGPCKMIAPILDEIAEEYDGRLKVAKLNIDENPNTPPKFGIRGIPTLMLFKGGEVEATKVGAVSKSQLTAFIDSNL